MLARRGAALEDKLREARPRRRPEVAGSLDLDDVVARILDSALRSRASTPPSSRSRATRAAAWSSRPACRARKPSSRGELGSKLAVPLEGELGPLGSLSVYSGTVPRSGRKVGDEVADLVRRAVPALDNAFRYREARRLADTDALTGLRNRRFFHETLQRECTRAHRYGRSLALLVLDLDDFKAINEQVGHLAGDAVLAETALRVRAVLRASDIACRVGGDEFAIILPEAGARQAAQLYDRVEEAVSAQPIGTIPRLTLSGGVAELVEGDDATTFFERADDALYRAKQAGKAQLFARATSRARAAPSDERGHERLELDRRRRRQLVAAADRRRERGRLHLRRPLLERVALGERRQRDANRRRDERERHRPERLRLAAPRAPCTLPVDRLQRARSPSPPSPNTPLGATASSA